MAQTRWLDDGQQAAWRAYLDSNRLLTQVLERQLQDDAGISLADYELLVRLSEAPRHRLRMAELADAAHATRSGVTRAVTRLEERGWVRRVDCPEDKRGTHAELTPAGMDKLRETAPGHVAAVRHHLVDLLSDDEVATMRGALERVRRHLLDTAG